MIQGFVLYKKNVKDLKEVLKMKRTKNHLINPFSADHNCQAFADSLELGIWSGSKMFATQTVCLPNLKQIDRNLKWRRRQFKQATIYSALKGLIQKNM